MAKAGKSIKKTFFDVKIPVTSSKVSLYGTTPEEFVGKVVKLDLTRNLRGKSLELKSKVKLEGNELVGEPISLLLVGSFIRRMIRKGSDYVEDSFIVDCKDAKIVIKPFLITRNKVSRAVRNELRNNSKKFLESYLKARPIKEVFSDLMANKLQKELSLKLKKIYPLALCEIRAVDILTEAEIKRLEEKAEEKASRTEEKAEKFEVK